MIAISLWQPWATAIAAGLKKCETRSWAAECVGQRIAIQAAKRDTPELRAWWMEKVKTRPEYVTAFARLGVNDWCDLPKGQIVLTATLAAVHRTETIVDEKTQRLSSPDEFFWGNYGPGRFAWELTGIEVLDVPVPVKGWQNFFTWDPATNETKGMPPACRGRVAA